MYCCTPPPTSSPPTVFPTTSPPRTREAMALPAPPPPSHPPPAHPRGPSPRGYSGETCLILIDDSVCVVYVTYTYTYVYINGDNTCRAARGYTVLFCTFIIFSRHFLYPSGKTNTAHTFSSRFPNP